MSNETFVKTEVTAWESTSPWDGLSDAFPNGETHEVAGQGIPTDIDEDVLAAVGAALILDGNGDDPTDGEGIPPMPVDEVAKLVAAATARNNEREHSVSYAAVANAVAMTRIYRFDHRNVCEMLLRHAEEGRLPVLMAAEGEQAIRRMRERLANPRSWSLWEIASGEWLDLALIDDNGTERTLVDNGPYVLTRKGEQLVGTEEGVLPMWVLMADAEHADPYECEELFREVTFTALMDEGLVWDSFDEDFWQPSRDW